MRRNGTKMLLVADADRGSRARCGRELRSLGYRVETARDGLEAVRKAQDLAPDLVILDVFLPVMDGLEATGRILEERHDVPVILYTEDGSVKGSFLSWCADAFVVKSDGLSRLTEAVQALLEQKGSDSHEPS